MSDKSSAFVSLPFLFIKGILFIKGREEQKRMRMKSKGGHTLYDDTGARLPTRRHPFHLEVWNRGYPRMPTATRCHRDLHLLLFPREARLQLRLCPEAVQDSGPMCRLLKQNCRTILHIHRQKYDARFVFIDAIFKKTVKVPL